MSSRWSTVGCGAAAVALALLGLAGCGGGIKTYPVRGKVAVEGGDAKDLAGCHVQFMLESDNLVQPDGLIGPDGSFEMQTLHDGKILRGAPEGAYKARIILGQDEDEGRPKRRGQPVHKRFLDFKTSGLSYQVPTSGDITVTVAKR
jgi:hypothetical protein